MVLGALLVFPPACVWLLWDAAQTVSQKPVGQWFPDVAFDLLWSAVVGAATAHMGWEACFKPTAPTRIDGAGIWIGGCLHPWEQVTWLWGREQRGQGVLLWFQEQSLLKLDQGIPLAQPLQQEQYYELLNSLASYLGKRFPNVDLG